MRYIKYLLLAVITIAVLVLSLANRQSVELNLFPEAVATMIGFNASVQLPLFVVSFLSIAVGLLIGILLEWIREYRIRAEGARTKKELRRVHKELKSDKAAVKDQGREILDLIEKA